jgi:predicted RNA-binding Zn ribbon-like protein
MAAKETPPPNGLGLVIDFVNTLDVEEETDELQSARGLTSWLRAHALLPDRHPQLTEADRERAIAVREALRAAMLANNGSPSNPAAARELERTACAGELGVHFDDGRARLTAGASGAPGALANLLVPVALAMGDGSWERVKACRDDGCEWAFYDRSRNRSGVWCNMAVCGNRSKVRTYRRRGPTGAR